MSTWPHYRDPNLTDEAAMLAMIEAANKATAAVLESRRDLLAAGIADTHPLCQVLDSFAGCMTRVVTHHQISSATRATRTAWRSSVAPVAAGSQWCAMYRETL